MFFRFLCPFIIIFLSSYLSADIRECSSTRQILEEVQPDTLFIFDIDNTLIRPCQVLGSDEWVDYCFKKKQEEESSPDEVKRSVIETWMAVQVLTKMRLIEEESPAVVAELQQKGLSVMVVTSRGEDVIRTTRLQLQSVGIDMAKATVCKESFFLNDFPTVHFVDGILFAGGLTKGDVLKSFLHQIGYTPKRIVFIDDKKSALISVSQLEKEGIEFVGLRYNRADPIVRSFDALVADHELAHLQQSLMSDEEAIKQLYSTVIN
jgi:hypothetical protein